MEDGIRQGNENDEIDIFTYVTEGTFDAYLYQLVQNKQEFISQIMTSKTSERSHEDIDEKALSYAEIKALATGNKLIVEKTELDTEVAKLKLIKQSYLSQKYALEDAIVKYYPIKIKEYEEAIKDIKQDIEIVKASTNIDNEEKFSTMKLLDKEYNTKESAGKMILDICSKKKEKDEEYIGKYRGMKMYLQIIMGNFVLTLKNKHSKSLNLGNDTYGNITRIDNAIDNFEKELDEHKIKLSDLNIQFEKAKVDVENPFDKEKELNEKIKRLEELNKELGMEEKDNEIVDENEEQEQERNECEDEPKQDIADREEEDNRW